MHKPAANALGSLALGSQQSKNAITAAGAVCALVALLGSDRPGVQYAAASALEMLGRNSQQSKDAIIAAGALPLFLAFSQSDKPPELKSQAAAVVRLLLVPSFKL